MGSDRVFQLWTISLSMSPPFSPHILVERENSESLEEEEDPQTKGNEGSELLPRAITPLSAETH